MGSSALRQDTTLFVSEYKNGRGWAQPTNKTKSINRGKPGALARDLRVLGYCSHAGGLERLHHGTACWRRANKRRRPSNVYRDLPGVSCGALFVFFFLFFF